MKLKIKRFLAKRRLEYAYYILDFYEDRRDVIGIMERAYIVHSKSHIRWLLSKWKTCGVVK